MELRIGHDRSSDRRLVMNCDYCNAKIDQHGSDTSDPAYGIISTQANYYPSVEIVCPACLEAAEEGIAKRLRKL